MPENKAPDDGESVRPARKKDNAQRRLERIKKRPRFLVQPIKIPKELRPAEANRALTLGFAPDDIPIRKAFKELSSKKGGELDPENPWHWRVLLVYLSDAFFGERKPRKADWNNGDLLELGLRAKGMAGESNLGTARNLIRAYKADYAHMSPKALAAKIREAEQFIDKSSS
jgi:hypothetical protein